MFDVYYVIDNQTFKINVLANNKESAIEKAKRRISHIGNFTRCVITDIKFVG